MSASIQLTLNTPIEEIKITDPKSGRSIIFDDFVLEDSYEDSCRISSGATPLFRVTRGVARGLIESLKEAFRIGDDEDIA